MANNFQVSVYQINSTVLVRDQAQKFGFPTTGVIIKDVSASPDRSLSSGYNVYGVIIVPNTSLSGTGVNWYYVQETFAQLATLIG